MSNIRDICIDDYNYHLPKKRIAKYPLADRDKCKLLVRDASGSLSKHIFAELPQLLPTDALLIRNNTRVINARLRFRKDNNGAPIEVFCLEPDTPNDYALNFATNTQCSWLCFVGNSKRWKQGCLTMPVSINGKPLTLTARRISKMGNTSTILFSWDMPDCNFAQIIEAVGEIPIPPYLNRATEASDFIDYQTVYSHLDGSVASPTAGLHFTNNLLEEIAHRGIPCRELTLHVGAGTFQPVKSKTIGSHEMHSEYIAVQRDLIDELANTGRKPIAVGTTSVRTLESLYHIGCMISKGEWNGILPQWYPYDSSHPNIGKSESLNAITDYLDATSSMTLVASTQLIIAPGYDYKIVKGMITNFHQPQSTLLLLVSAFIGDEWKPMYDFALSNGFRFLSYGDATLLL